MLTTSIFIKLRESKRLIPVRSDRQLDLVEPKYVLSNIWQRIASIFYMRL
jgi:hypothetical protein